MRGILPESHGKLVAYQSSNPAAGSVAVITQPSNVRWRLISARVSLTTSIAAVNRLVSIEVLIASLSVCRFVAPRVQSGGEVVEYCFGAGVGIGAPSTSSLVVGSLGVGVVVGNGVTIETTTLLLDGGDDFGVLTLLVEEWIEA